MCGIAVEFGRDDGDGEGDEGREMVARRGPDHSELVVVAAAEAAAAAGKVKSIFASCLFMRARAAPQPMQNDEYVLAFNGEIYSLEAEDSDTEFVFRNLVALGTPEQRVEFLSRLEGEWALALYCKTDQSLLFGRDGLGRRSLLVAHSGEEVCCVASTMLVGSPKTWKWTELSCDAMFQLSSSGGCSSVPRPSLPPNRPLLGAGLETWERFLLALDGATRRRMASHTVQIGRPAVLFSGGIDSVLVAACAHRVLPASQPIQLVNVSFAGAEAPDRVAGELALEELRQAFPTRAFVFTRVDVDLSEVKRDELEIVQHMFPKTTVMDFNLSAVLWFASKHCGAEARALISGVGADELCGGYARHKTQYERHGLDALRQELAMDVNRLWLRNFGRDDRAVAAFGRELRMPFVDSDVMHVVQTSPIHDLMSFYPNSSDNDSQGGDKLVLRRIAGELGLANTAKRTKRAAQFGSRMAKLIRPGCTGTHPFAVGHTLL